MKLILKLLLLLSIMPLSIFSQDQIQKFMVGTRGSETRVVISFIEPLEDSFKMQSMIFDFDSIKNKSEQPKSISVDLTSTVRSLGTGKKDQKILLIRWNKAEEIEMKCDGKWTKKESNLSAQKIIETTKTIIQNIPLNTKEPTEFTLSSEMIEKIKALMDSMKTENFSCLKINNN